MGQVPVLGGGPLEIGGMAASWEWGQMGGPVRPTVLAGGGKRECHPARDEMRAR